jgi:hypothetical protein
MKLGPMVYDVGNPPVEWKSRAEAAEARAARLEAALRRISDMCPATQEMTVAHMMADEAADALDVKEAG